MKEKLILVLVAVAIVFAIVYRNKNVPHSKQISPITGVPQSDSSNTVKSMKQPVKLDPNRANPAYKPVEYKGIQSIPPEKVDAVIAKWKTVIGTEGFKTSEFVFKKGSIRSERGQSTGMQVGIWKDLTGKCRLELQMLNYVITNQGQIICST